MTNSLLWKIQKKDHPAKAFLFGTIHVYDSNVFGIPDMIYKLIDEVDIYSPETDNRLTSYVNMLNYMTVDDPNYSLKDYLSPESYVRILNIAGIDTDILDRYKPFFVSSLILKDKDMPDDSIDGDLLNYAADAGKTICELESVDEQIGAIDNIPYKEQSEIIENAILSLDSKNDFKKLINSYKEQNLQALKENLKEMNPAKIFIDSIQKNRNINMSNKIVSMLNAGHSLFVAVGAMHIPDTDDVKGIVSLLADKDYKVEPMNFSFIY
ncbi:MAG: TraB/GumN family protein [Prevotellaceae bacterium]|jgi:uncharacterized protein YbaP (TraB family)|nr:TraB/GumN family protein [Prevotellaceae bacterium]